MLEYVTGALIGLILGGIVAFLSKDGYYSKRVSRLEELIADQDEIIESYRNKEKSVKGHLVKQEKAERMQSAMLEFAVAMKEPNANITEILKSMAAKYPDIAMDLAKKGMFK
jgi:predicted SPOUT superfamily RNA methylase MTH1